jgi:molybdenum cofactor cytidylyltransferase
VSEEAPIAAVVLAAGGSTRLGRPKQLVPIGGEPLVRRAARAALDAGCRPVTVVLGAEPDAVRAAVADLPVLPVSNAHWADGVGSSIACGIRAAAAHRPAGCIVLPCDQPRLTAALLATLIDRFRRGEARAVACAYGGTTGAPVLFAPDLFDRLSALTGDSGAKRVLRGCSPLQVVDFPGGELDIDTDADLRRAKSSA